MATISRTYTNDDFCNFAINGKQAGRYGGVVSYKYGFNNPIITLSSLMSKSTEPVIIIDDSKCDIYFIFDNQGLDALAHWIYESFIFYPLFIEVQRIYPRVKVLTTNRKRYVKNMFQLFNIQVEIVYSIESTDNLCFFHPILGINEESGFNVPLLKTYLEPYILHIRSFLTQFDRQYELVYFPRNKKDNFAYNVVEIKGQVEMEQEVIEYGGIIADTYDLNNIHLQFQILNNSKAIIIDYGSSSLFNLIFLKGKTIFILNNRGWFHSHFRRFVFNKLHHAVICSNNKVIVVEPNADEKISFGDIKKLM